MTSASIINPVGAVVGEPEWVWGSVSSQTFAAGDIVTLRPGNFGSSEAKYSVIAVNGSLSDQVTWIYGVVMEAVASTDTKAKICIRGLVQAQVYESTAITNTACLLVSSAYDSSISTVDALTSPADIDTQAITCVVDGGASAAVQPYTAKILGLFAESAAGTGSNIHWVLFNGVEGFGTVSGPVTVAAASA
jgi:hypothetical protein